MGISVLNEIFLKLLWPWLLIELFGSIPILTVKQNWFCLWMLHNVNENIIGTQRT